MATQDKLIVVTGASGPSRATRARPRRRAARPAGNPKSNRMRAR